MGWGHGGLESRYESCTGLSPLTRNARNRSDTDSTASDFCLRDTALRPHVRPRRAASLSAGHQPAAAKTRFGFAGGQGVGSGAVVA